MSYIIPKDELSISKMEEYRAKALAAAIDRIVNKLGGAPREYETRMWQNILDAPGAPLEQWNTAALAVVGNPYSVFQNQPVVALANNKFAVFYGIAIETAPCPVSRLTFRVGAIAGNVLAEFDLERIINATTVEGYFSQPVPIDPGQTFACQVTCRIATGAIARVQLWNMVIDTAGSVIA